MNTDDKIRAILLLEADAVEPSAAGWDAIQAGVAARRGRVWWNRGFAAAGAAAVVAGAVLYVAADGSPRGIEQTPTSPGPSSAEPTGSPQPSVTASPPPVAVRDEPIDAVWPLTTTGEVAAWEADRATYPSLATATGSVTAFARTYLGIADAAVTALEGQYGENAFQVKRAGALVSTVTVRGFGAGGTAPFVVIGAEAPDLRVAAPVAGSTVDGSFTVRGGYEAVDPAIDVTVRGDTGAVLPVELAKARATTGPTGWRAPVTVTTSLKTGSVLVTNASLRDGGIGSAAVVPVRFGPAPAVAGPKVMVAARDGRIAVLSTATGDVVRWLTEAEPGGGAHDPELSSDGRTVYYVQAAGTCASEIRSVPVTGGPPTTVVGGGEGALRSPSRLSDTLAYVRTLCQDGGAREEVVMTDGHTTWAEAVDGTVRSHVVTSGRYVVYISQQGTATTLHSVDFFRELADVPTKAPDGCSWEAVTAGARETNGRAQLFAAASCGPRDEVVETRLYRLDADARGLTLVTKLDVRGVRSLDFAGEHLVIGTTSARDGDRAYAWVDGRLRLVPGDAQRPTWS